MKKTKNRIKYKKTYIVGADGDRHAPFTVALSYPGLDEELDEKLEDLAERNSGSETGSGYSFDGERDISYDFFTEKGLKQFVKKAKTRYAKSKDLSIDCIQRAVLIVDFEEIDL